MEIIEISNKKYYLVENLIKLYPNYFTDILHPRDIINLKQLNDNEYLFVRKNKENQWLLSTRKYHQAKLIISQEWCFKHIIEMKPKIENIFPLAFLLKKIDI
jgi:hypothetical protein